MKNNPKKAEVACPICIQNFIPEAFHIEEVIMETYRDRVVSDRSVVNKLTIKPSNHIRKVWITKCPHCNYVLRFTAEVAKKELKELEGKKISSFAESGTTYFYNLYNYPKPYMDYTDYYNEAISNIKVEINKSLETLNIDEWGGSMSRFFNRKKHRSFQVFNTILC